MSKKLSISDLETSDIVKDMANVLNIDFDENHNEYCLRIPKKIGSGSVKVTIYRRIEYGPDGIPNRIGIGVIKTMLYRWRSM